MTRATVMVLLGAWMLGAAPSPAAMVSGMVTIAGKPPADAVVYLESPGDTPPAPARAAAVMDQKNLAFAPAVLPVARGTAVRFTNGDDVQHNVFSPSAIAGKFDLGTHGPGAERTLTFNELGDVLVLCNIHMEMVAHILVLKDPYFAVPTRDGRYEIADVPPGTYTLKVWQERLLPYTQTVEVPASGKLTVDVHAGE